METPKASSVSRRSLVRGASFLAVVGAAATGLKSSPVLADEKDRIRRRKKGVEDQLDTLRDDLSEVEADLAQAYLDLAETELRIPEAQAALDQARTAAQKAREEDERLAQRLSTAEDEERALLDHIETGRLTIQQSDADVSQASLQAYKGTGVPSPASVFLGAESPQDAVDRTMNYRLTLEAQGAQLASLRHTQAVNVNAADRLTAVREEIGELRVQAAQALREREQAEAQAEQAKKDLDALYDSQKAQSTSLQSLKDKYRAQETQLNAEAEQLGADLQAILDEERRRAEAEAEAARKRQAEAEAEAARRRRAGSTSAPAPAPPQVPSSGSRQFINPVVGRRSSMFGWRIHPIYRVRRLHGGMDYAVPCGTPVGAMAAGRVIATTYNQAAGNKLLISHGMHNGQLLTSSYHHLQGFALSVGANVAQGQTIGYVGTTGTSTGCHLHFETHLDGQKLDPRRFVG